MPNTIRAAEGLVVATTALTKAYGGRIVVDRVNLKVRKGSMFGLIGPNGAGKSTIIKMLATLLPPTGGSAQVAGCDLETQAPEIRARIGYVPQLLSADGALTGFENLLLSARLYLVPDADRLPRIREALARAQLTDAADRPAQTYSGGMLRRLEIAQSTLHRPQLLIMDEPTVGLDPVARATVWAHVRDLRDRFGTSVLLTTHAMDEADVLCDEIGVLHKGRLEASGTPSDLKKRIGPAATLDDVFARIAGMDIETAGRSGDTREARRSAMAHE